MQFDPAVAAQHALHRAEEEDELGALRADIADLEETFSSSAGEEATRAFSRLQELGEQLPGARHYQEFLIYITWQQVTDETVPRHFETGARLCDRFLARFGRDLDGTESARQVLEIRRSFRQGMGHQDDATPSEYDEDAFKGGD